MNTEQVLKLNQVERAEYVKPKWWAKEGERLVRITAKPNGNLIVRASLTDDCVIWFSQSKWNDEETLTSVLQVILDTQREPNAVWHTTDLKKILAPLNLSLDNLSTGFCRSSNLCSDRILDWKDAILPRTQDAAAILARQLILILMENQKKSEGVNGTLAMHHLEDICLALKPLAEITDPNRIYQAYSQANELQKKLLEWEFLWLSEDLKLRELYASCESMYHDVYNHYMSVAR